MGRDDLLGQLCAHFAILQEMNGAQQHHVTSRQACLTIYGLGGVGKTQLALKFIRDYSQHSFRVWFSAETPEHLQRSYEHFAYWLGQSRAHANIKIVGADGHAKVSGNISIHNIHIYINDKKATPELIRKAVKDWFHDNPGWLIVYDNAKSYESFQDYLPEGKGHILITSRNPNWPASWTPLPVNVMTSEDATELLAKLIAGQKRAKDDLYICKLAKDPITKELAKELGYLPLALAQAGAYIERCGKTPSEYLNLYRRQHINVLKKKMFPPGIQYTHTLSDGKKHYLTVATTWIMSLEAIQQEAKKKDETLLASTVLTACAYLAADNISRLLLQKWLQQTYPDEDAEMVIDEIVDQLCRYSLWTANVSKDTFAVHRLVQTVMRYEGYQRAKSAKYLNSLSKLLINEFYCNYTHVGLSTQYILHMLTTYNYAKKSVENEDGSMVDKYLLASLGVQIANYKLYYENIFIGVHELLEDSMRYLCPKERSDEAIDLFKIKMLRASIYEKISFLASVHLKDYSKATKACKEGIALYNFLLETSKKYPVLLGYAIIKHFLGDIYRYTNNFEQALIQYKANESIIDNLIKLVNTENQIRKKEVYSIRNLNLQVIGNTYLGLSDYVKAEIFFRKCLGFREELFGKYHLHTGATYHKLGVAKMNLAIKQTNINSYLEAMYYLNIAVFIKTLFLPKTNPWVQVVYHDLQEFLPKVEDITTTKEDDFNYEIIKELLVEIAVAHAWLIENPATVVEDSEREQIESNLKKQLIFRLSNASNVHATFSHTRGRKNGMDQNFSAAINKKGITNSELRKFVYRLLQPNFSKINTRIFTFNPNCDTFSPRESASTETGFEVSRPARL